MLLSHYLNLFLILVVIIIRNVPSSAYGMKSSAKLDIYLGQHKNNSLIIMRSIVILFHIS